MEGLFFATAHDFRMPFDRCIAIHHDEQSELGTVKLDFGGKTDNNRALNSIFDVTGTQNFARLSIGIGHPKWKQIQSKHLPTWEWSENHYREWFLMNKFPPGELKMVEEIILPRVLEVMEFALSVEKREDFIFSHTTPYQDMENKLKLRCSE
eukprot:TRINITY_DN1767_c0_g1_i1.p2 TRINITY_DN1767_c0_g1~~TRINITY_DN1767_c0_g1_i1.p2  ORF type:complete len:152 (-),score=22.29 TRINITY_DN1767_c0_g1_i1:26-481(-)